MLLHIKMEVTMPDYFPGYNPPWKCYTHLVRKPPGDSRHEPGFYAGPRYIGGKEGPWGRSDFLFTTLGDNTYKKDPWDIRSEPIVWDGDTISGGAGNDVLSGGIGYDELSGDAGDDTLRGDSGDDRLYGDAGNDWIAGENGRDFVSGGDGNDIVGGQDGLDTVLGGAGDDQVWGGAGGDVLGGGGDNDWIAGESGNDLINGGDGNDFVSGQEGRDEIQGGNGNDELWGGSANDSFVFNTALNANSNVDRIMDFSVVEGDKILLDHNVFKALAMGNLSSAAFKVGAATSKAQHILYNQGTGELFYDADGSGYRAPIKFAVLTPGTAIDASLFLVV
jgi:Ca2+-binding RTX toxin-like protein